MEETPPGNQALLTEIRDDLREIKQETAGLSKSVDALSTSVGRSRRWAWVMAAMIVVISLLGVGLAVVVWRNYTNGNCIRHWANETSARSQALSGPANARIAAEDKLFADAGEKPPDQALIATDYEAYKRAAKKYHAAFAGAPLPLSYRCHSF
jgi:hypothetical protein